MKAWTEVRLTSGFRHRRHLQPDRHDTCRVGLYTKLCQTEFQLITLETSAIVWLYNYYGTEFIIIADKFLAKIREFGHVVDFSCPSTVTQ